MISDAPRGISLGAFDLHREIGRGGTCSVWRGVHRAQQIPVAIKIMRPDFLHSSGRSDVLEIFQSEARAAASLHHPHIIQVYDVGQLPVEVEEASEGHFMAGSPYIAMELASGGGLRQKSLKTWSDVRAVLLSLLDALAHAHACGVIHRDIKPANILVCNRSDIRPGLKLTDFGIAHILGPKHTEGEQLDTRGTPLYMSPEHIQAQWRDYGPWTDLYSLGCVAYEMLCGRSPYQAESWHQLFVMHVAGYFPPLEPVMTLPDGVDEWMHKMVARAPSQRFQCAADAAWALKALAVVSADARMPVDPDNAEFAEVMDSLTVVSVPLPIDTPMEVFVEIPRREVGARQPVPMDWRPRQIESEASQLQGVGLGLFHLRTLPLVGREYERDVLWDVLRHTHEEKRPGLVLLEGPAGTGKSRLAEWLCRRAHEVGAATVLEATHSPSNEPSDGLSSMLARHLGCVGLDNATSVARLEGWLRMRGVEDDYEWRALAQWLTPAVEGRQVVYFSSPRERYLLLRRLLNRIALRRPVVMWLDDLQWGVEAQSFVRFLLETPTSRLLPIFVVATVRVEALEHELVARREIDGLRQMKGVLSLPIAPLPQVDHRELVRQLIGLEGSLARRVEARTAGNPLFAVQLVGDWIQRGILDCDGQSFALKSGVDVPLPEHLHQVWATHIEHILSDLPEDARRALELAAVLGQHVDRKEWESVCEVVGVERPPMLLQRLFGAQLAIPTGEGWRFTHGMLRESVLQSDKGAQRLAEHTRACLEILRPNATTSTDLERLGLLCAAGGLVEQAIDFFEQALKRSQFQNDFTSDEKIIAHLLELQIGLGLDEASEGVLLARIRQVNITARRGQIKEARQRLVEIDAIFDEASRTTMLRLHYHRVHALVAVELGDRGRSREHYQTALVLSDEVGDPLWRVYCRVVVGTTLRRHGDYHGAISMLEEAYQILQDAGLRDNPHYVYVGHYRAVCYTALRMWPESIEALRENIHEARERGLRVILGHSLESMGEVFRHGYKDLEKAERLYREALAVASPAGATETLSKRINLSLVLIARSQYTQARQELEIVHRIIETSGLKRNEVWVLWALLACQASTRRWTHWPVRFDAAVEAVGALVDKDLGWLMQLTGGLAAQAGRTADARRALQLARHQWERQKLPEKVQQVDAALSCLP